MADCGASGATVDRSGNSSGRGGPASTNGTVPGGGGVISSVVATAAGNAVSSLVEGALGRLENPSDRVHGNVAAMTNGVLEGGVQLGPVDLAAYDGGGVSEARPFSPLAWIGHAATPPQARPGHTNPPSLHWTQPIAPPANLLMFQQQQQQMHMMMMMQTQQIQQLRTMTAQQKQQEADATKPPSSPSILQPSDATTKEPRADRVNDLASSWRADTTTDETATSRTSNVAERLDEFPISDATVEQLSAAWAQAEAELSATDLASIYNSYHDDDEYEASGTERPYHFSEESRSYRVGDVVVGEQPEGTTTAAPPSIDLMAEGMRHFDVGHTRKAIAAFEAEVRHVHPDNADAWRMLGRCHAENDQDVLAIACLERAVERDPYSPEALLALGVSYLNELDHPRALRNLRAWITHNPTYAGMDIDLNAESAGGPSSSLDELKNLLKRAAEFDPSSSADVEEALGVVYNVSREYDKAADCFQRAVKVRPDDHQLWNKLGATLANGGRSEEALPSYHRALGIKPRYARGWLNMAIAHSNLHNYEESARCYLQTLSLNPEAVHIWNYVRIVLTSMERWDLLPLAASQNLKGFAEHFDFVPSGVET